MPPTPVKPAIVVFGAGGVGGYFGGRLAQAGHRVSFVARGAHRQAIEDHGLRVQSIEGDFVVHGLNCRANPEELGIADVVLVATKAFQVREAAIALRPIVGPDTLVIPLQNGVDAPAELAEELGPERVLGGMCAIYSEIAGPGQIRHSGAPPIIRFGELSGDESERVSRLGAALQGAVGMTVETPRSVARAMWNKFIFISAVSGLGALSRAPMGVLRGPMRPQLRQAIAETTAVGRALNVPLAVDIVENTLAFCDKMPAQSTASMQRDIIAGRPSELDQQNGAVVRKARALGIEVPLHELVWACLSPMEATARGTVNEAQV